MALGWDEACQGNVEAMWPWGSAIACAVRRSEKLLHSLQGFKGFKGKHLRAGKRQAWTPIKGFQGFEGF